MWLEALAVNPIPALLSREEQALTHFVRRDLQGEPVEPLRTLWEIPEAKKLVEKQGADGSWCYPGKSYNPQTGTNYFLVETFRNLRVLVEMYGFQRSHPTLQKAAEYLFTCQTEQGDIRGILGNQYMPYYHGAILELLVKAGYVEDGWIKKGLDWLLDMRQEDGGWIVPVQAVPTKQRGGGFWHGPPVPPDRKRPFSHMATGMIIRPLAAHPEYRHRPEVIAAGAGLKERFFKSDQYNDRKTPAYWLKFQFPFWWANLLTALDSLSRLGFARDDPDISGGLSWFLSNQSPDGLWETSYGSGKSAARMRAWVGLAVCRMLKRFYGGLG
jgi:hypothetical protein